MLPQDQGHVPPQVKEKVSPEVPNDPLIGNSMFEKFTSSITLLAQDLTSQANRGEVASTNPIREMGATTVRGFLGMNPPVRPP